MQKSNKHAQLLVEGDNDQHVIWALCKEYKVPEIFSVEKTDGITQLLEGIPVRLKSADIQTLGVVIDADQNLHSRWDAVRSRFVKAGYIHFPIGLTQNGLVHIELDKPRIGVWLM